MNFANKIFTSQQVRKIDAYTINNEPISSIKLMERASQKMADWIMLKYTPSSRFFIFTGPGNNGGDALAIGRLLFFKGYKTKVFFVARDTTFISENTKINLKRIQQETTIQVIFINSKETFPTIKTSDILIDGLFGSGLSRPLEGIYASLVNYLNNTQNEIISIDIPSGLFDAENSKNPLDNILQATYTLSLESPKLCFFLKDYARYVGKWKVLPIGLHPNAIAKEQVSYYYFDKSSIQKLLKKRDKFSHKSCYGHALLIGGAKGKIGAMVLGARACLRSGVGLITTYSPKCGYTILQSAVPESMAILDNNEDIITGMPDIKHYNAIGIGPGMGQDSSTAIMIEKFFKTIKSPLVIDADAINIIAKSRTFLEQLPPNTIFTPHVKEFKRLCNKPFNNVYQKIQQQREFSIVHKCIVVLKGAYTSISLPNGKVYFNTTGNPGMATAGSGDVLTGVILSLLAQSYTPAKASFLGTFLHGLAGDLAIKKYSKQGLIANDIIKALPLAWKYLHKY